jgi:hypothetical protein
MKALQRPPNEQLLTHMPSRVGDSSIAGIKPSFSTE